MARNVEEGFKEYEELFAKEVILEFLNEPHVNTQVYKKALQYRIELSLNTGNQAADRFMNTMIDGMNNLLMDIAKEQIRLAFLQAEKEVQDLHKRTKQGMLTAKPNGKQIGGVPGKKLITKKSLEKKAEILKHARTFGGSLTDIECMKLTGISRNTYYKYKKELLAEQK